MAVFQHFLDYLQEYSKPQNFAELLTNQSNPKRKLEQLQKSEKDIKITTDQRVDAIVKVNALYQKWRTQVQPRIDELSVKDDVKRAILCMRGMLVKMRVSKDRQTKSEQMLDGICEDALGFSKEAINNLPHGKEALLKKLEARNICKPEYVENDDYLKSSMKLLYERFKKVKQAERENARFNKRPQLVEKWRREHNAAEDMSDIEALEQLSFNDMIKIAEEVSIAVPASTEERILQIDDILEKVKRKLLQQETQRKELKDPLQQIHQSLPSHFDQSDASCYAVLGKDAIKVKLTRIEGIAELREIGIRSDGLFTWDKTPNIDDISIPRGSFRLRWYSSQAEQNADGINLRYITSVLTPNKQSLQKLFFQVAEQQIGLDYHVEFLGKDKWRLINFKEFQSFGYSTIPCSLSEMVDNDSVKFQRCILQVKLLCKEDKQMSILLNHLKNGEEFNETGEILGQILEFINWLDNTSVEKSIKDKLLEMEHFPSVLYHTSSLVKSQILPSLKLLIQTKWQGTLQMKNR